MLSNPRKNQKKHNDDQESIKSRKYAIPFIKEKQTYNITSSLKEKSFLSQSELKAGNKYLLKILEEPIKQNIIPLYIS